jgi:hypothetical protein
MQIEVGVSQISFCNIQPLTNQRILSFYEKLNIKSVSAIPSVIQLMEKTKILSPTSFKSDELDKSILFNSIQGVLYGISPEDADVKNRVRKRIAELDKYLNDWSINEIVLGSISFRKEFDAWRWLVQEFYSYVKYKKINLSLEMFCNSMGHCNGQDENLIGGLQIQSDSLFVFDFANSLECLNHNYEKFFLSNKIASVHLAGKNHSMFGFEDLKNLKNMLLPKILFKVPVYWEFIGYNNWADLELAVKLSTQTIHNLFLTD